MKTAKHLISGQFVTVTTRRANYTNAHFGWFTVWQSKEHYDKGDCTGVIEYKNIYLGNDSKLLSSKINAFINDNQHGFNQILQEIKAQC